MNTINSDIKWSEELLSKIYNAKDLYTKEEVIEHIKNIYTIYKEEARFRHFMQGISYQYWGNTGAYDFTYHDIQVARFRNGVFVMWLGRFS